jgi:hypothetical protein
MTLRRIMCGLVALLAVRAPAYGQQTTPPPLRSIPVPSPTGTTDAFSVVIGQNLTLYLDRVLERRVEESGAIFPCDFAYDGRTRKTCIRSLNLVEVDDAVDVRFYRFPGTYPNDADRRARLRRGALIGQIGASGINADGDPTAYQTVIQFHTNGDGTGYMCLSAATGKANHPRNDSSRLAPADEAICHAMLLFNGTLVIGADTDPAQLPPHSLVIHGNVDIEGCLRVSGVTYGQCLPSNPPDR